ncbi:MAG: 5'-nucleotidase C-terminal domain-containing protein [Petrimonas sp.]|jgi:2',3'-cyclic-nucleotide 2'-phosphodiesterase (5'-nucleotidase family)|nr:MAG: Endonuclease YhcR precursor [Bacteroidetes bacterium ADurb.BinA174]
MKKLSIIFTLAAILLISCKSQQYGISNMSGAVVEMNNNFDADPDKKMQALVQKYKAKLDNEMNEVIGTSTKFMDYTIPESLLTNFTSDVMKAYGDEHLPDGTDLAVMNVHGHRSNMPEGKVTVGNLYEIYSFDNAITFLKLKGTDLNKIFDSFARMGGFGISSNVKLVIKNQKVQSVTVDGKPVDTNKIYSITTLDYLADGNNGMDAFRNALKATHTGLTLRDMMIDYVKEQTRQGKEITSKLDGRITIVE